MRLSTRSYLAETATDDFSIICFELSISMVTVSGSDVTPRDVNNFITCNLGKINFKEFVCGVSIATRGTPEEKLTWTFNVYDVNNDGTITREEIGEIMRVRP